MSRTHSPSAHTHHYAHIPCKVHRLKHIRTHRFSPTYFTLPSLLLFLMFSCTLFFSILFSLQSPEQLLIKTLEICLSQVGREWLRMENSRMETVQIDVRLNVDDTAEHLETSVPKWPWSNYHSWLCVCVSHVDDMWMVLCSSCAPIGLRKVCLQGKWDMAYDTTSFIHWGWRCVCYSWIAHVLNTNTHTHTCAHWWNSHCMLGYSSNIGYNNYVSLWSLLSLH